MRAAIGTAPRGAAPVVEPDDEEEPLVLLVGGLMMYPETPVPLLHVPGAVAFWRKVISAHY
jgi:hypothetical protein